MTVILLCVFALQTQVAEPPPASSTSPAPESATPETKTDVLSMKNLKITGYVQPRFIFNENSKPGIKADRSASVTDGFTVRRGRLKATYTLPHSQVLLQIDATGRSLSLKDAEVHLIEPWSGKKFELILGQHKWPFGYEVMQSSSEREFPERTRVVRAFAQGERDRGAKVVGKVGPMRLALGIFDGNGIDNRNFSGVDNDRKKDGVGRLGFDFSWIAFGVSGWYGETLRPRDTTVTPNLTPEYFNRQRVGADLQLYLDLLPVGGSALKLEAITGETYFKDGVEQFGKKALGGWALLVQNLGLATQVAVRYDWFDPDTDADTADDLSAPTNPASNNPVGTLGVALLYHWDEALKVTLAYEMPRTAVVNAEDPKDDVVTLQLQGKF